MNDLRETEYWMAGPVGNIPALLQPVAHTILQVRREVHQVMKDFPENLLWQRLFGMASPAFHLQHIAGVLDRLFTYARGEALSAEQFRYLSAEGKELPGLTLNDLLRGLDLHIENALLQLSKTDPHTLIDFRGVGRKQLPSSVMGLLFHASEHAMRHTGQLMVTVKCLKETSIQTDAGS